MKIVRESDVGPKSDPTKHSFENYLRVHNIYRNSIVEFSVNGKPCSARISDIGRDQCCAIGIDDPTKVFIFTMEDFEQMFMETK